MDPGKTLPVTITMKNIGKVVWANGSVITLLGISDAAEFGPLALGIPEGDTVPPGGSYTWSFVMTAPSTQGEYTPAYQIFNGDTPSGDLLSKSVGVYWPTIQFNVSTYSVTENGGDATIEVIRSANTNDPVSVTYNVTDGTGIAGIDYLASNGTLDFAGGEIVKTFNITIIDDGVLGNDKTVDLALKSPTNGSLLGARDSAVLTIKAKPTINFTYHLVPGWNLISVPLNLLNDSVDAFFPSNVKTNIRHLWYFENGTWYYYSGTNGYSTKYQHLTTLESGKGYWVKVDVNTTFDIVGSPASGIQPVYNGWNLIGVRGLTAHDPITTYGTAKHLWYYDNGKWYYNSVNGFSSKYANLTILEPGRGYWVKMEA
jgi:hypothetical protein